jgi:hypothetical protein
MPGFFLVRAAKGRRIVAWTVLCFAASQLALWTYLDARYPEVRDPLYALRLRSLQARQAESPNSPLLLFLGSSRIKYGLWPAAMNVRSAEGSPSPVIYNFGINGAGAIRELMYFRRLMADGVRPDWLFLETWPPLWVEDGFFAEAKMIAGADELHGRDVPLVCRYFGRKPSIWRQAVRQCLLPLSMYRARLTAAAAACLLPRQQLAEMTRQVSDWLPSDDNGWFPLTWGPTTPEQKRRVLKESREQVKPLIDGLRIDPRSDAALRELLDECRRRGIKTALILMPEPSLTRSWYPPPARMLIHDYLGGLRREYGVPIVDSRDWVPDERFADFCHMAPPAAAPFADRLGRDVVQPLLQGQPLSTSVLLREKPAAAP